MLPTYPRLQGKKSKKLKEKRRKEKMKKHLTKNSPHVNTSEFMGVDYDDSIFTPWLNEDGTMKEEKDEAGEKYSKRSLKKYTKIGIDVANHFYEKESDSSEESSSEESNSEMEEESSDEMPLPTFLLNKHSMDFNPNEIEDTMSEKQIQKEEHKTRKIFAKTKEKGIIRVFQFLMNNEFIDSFTFVPIPVSSPELRSMINRYCEKFDLLMNTKQKNDWYIITISKPAKWSKKNIQKGKVKTSVEKVEVSEPIENEQLPMTRTLMEGLSTPIGNDNYGRQMLMKMGWTSGGLGQEGTGIEEPIQIHIKRDNKGIGANDASDYSGGSGMSFVKASDS